MERTERDKLAKVQRGLLLSVLKEEYVKYGSQAQQL
jgi:hypothetical protein